MVPWSTWSGTGWFVHCFSMEEQRCLQCHLKPACSVACAQMQIQMQQRRVQQYSSEEDSPRAAAAARRAAAPSPPPVIRQRSDGKPERQAAKRFKSAVQLHGEGSIK